jgi:hypothetical protein
MLKFYLLLYHLLQFLLPVTSTIASPHLFKNRKKTQKLYMKLIFQQQHQHNSTALIKYQIAQLAIIQDSDTKAW